MKKKNSIFTIKSKMVKLSPTKVNLTLNDIRKKPYIEIVQILQKLPQKKGIILKNLFLTLIANISNLLKINKNQLFLLETFATKGAILKRQQPRAKGQSYLIQKRFSYITLKICTLFEYITLEMLYYILLF
jgi:large subunit ribosomal protein L22